LADVFDQIAAVREAWDVLRHPFYVRWSRGELTRDELAVYAGQYRHAVVALAEAAEHAGAEHAAEERAHVALWDDFLCAVGGSTDDPPTPESAACVAAWSCRERDGLSAQAALYAIEASQPAISETKRSGLLRFYGLAPSSAATRYFDVHAELDHHHAADGAKRLAALATPDDAPRLVAAAEEALRANWTLLDGVSS
jgi:pyrroloquinoline-quinone synthase